ncbi:MAG: 50S ribosomal protein L10 [Chloroflexi bacterium]|nr:50S ribosomal protein L10 [Chloroflexota bacterium]
MLKEKKASIIEALQQEFASSNISLLTDYRGMTAAELNELRRKLRAAKAELKVTKNTLARFAAQKAGKGNVASLLEGPVAIAFGRGDAAELAKLLTDYIRGAKTNLSIKGGMLGSRVLTPEDVSALSTLPSREVLIAQVLGSIQAPIAALLAQLAAPLSGLRGVLEARIKQLEGGAS